MHAALQAGCLKSDLEHIFDAILYGGADMIRKLIVLPVRRELQLWRPLSMSVRKVTIDHQTYVALC